MTVLLQGMKDGSFVFMVASGPPTITVLHLAENDLLLLSAGFHQSVSAFGRMIIPFSGTCVALSTRRWSTSIATCMPHAACFTALRGN